MRFSKLILTALFAIFAVLAGLFIATVAALLSAVGFFLRLLGTKPAVARQSPMFRPTEKHRARANDVDVIDVTATEVPTDVPGR